ncbi:MAG: hypothetical protein JRJ29_00505 [Deltaproteobacteria bacterium]|nr:hypothetical protein [Deltaproteobacteria bacterium]MBW2081649.1 hypothetical protein [Deltaproteobacteria bacterium]
MTFSELKTQVKNNLGGRTDKDSIIAQMINFAVQQMAKAVNWNDLRQIVTGTTLSSGDHTVSLPSNIRLLTGMRIVADGTTNYQIVEVIDQKEFENKYPDPVPTVSGTPVEATVYGRTIYFDKKADQDYNLYLYARVYPTDMSDDDDEPSMTGVDHMIIALATALMYLHLKQPESASVWFDLYKAFQADAMNEVTGATVTLAEPN